MSKGTPMTGKLNLLMLAFILLLLAIGSIFWACQKDQSALQSRPAGRDTTSHDFEWKIYTFDSPYSSGDLYDVAIINENDIWAVGEIYSDSTKPWVPYNAVHWDGKKWELNRIPFTGWCSAVEFPPIRSILTFSENSIWFARGGSLVHYNGNNFYNDCNINPLLDGSINKIWGTNSSNLYVVGGVGTIVHYFDNNWQRIESGTEIHFRDIWGSVNEQTGEWEILALASYMYGGRGLDLIKISGNTVEHLDTTGLRISEATLWFESGKCYYVGGDGLFYKKNLQDSSWKEIEGLPSYFTNSIRGNNEKDIFIVGAYGLVSHFNGKDWFTYSGKDFPYFQGTFNSVCFKNNLVVAVGIIGFTADKVIILKGIRN